MSEKLRLYVNGEQREVEGGWTVLDLLSSLDLGSQRVAVAQNGQVISKSQHGEVLLAEGDRVEIVRMVGGG